MPKPYPKEFRDDVVCVARNREPGQLLKQVAADFGISKSRLTGWMKSADVAPPDQRSSRLVSGSATGIFAIGME